jgi:hypothetical protein
LAPPFPKGGYGLAPPFLKVDMVWLHLF